MKKTLVAIIISLFFMAETAGTADCTPFSYELGRHSSIETSGTTIGLILNASVFDHLDDIGFSLDNGESYTFDFARIWTPEFNWANADDLNNTGAVTASIDFDLPDLQANITGDSIAFTGTFRFLCWEKEYQGWKLTWDDPVSVYFGNGGHFQIELDDVEHNKFSNIFCNVVGATVKQISSPSTNVPEPSLMLMLGIGLVGVSRMKKLVEK